MSDSDLLSFLRNSKEKYIEAQQLIESSKDDPVSEPYKSKYAAAEVLRAIASGLNKFENVSGKESARVSLISSLLNYELGVIAFETEDLNSSEKHLEDSWEAIKEYASKPECVILAVNVLNQLGILWCGRNEPRKACNYLKQAEIIYGEYKLDKKRSPNTSIELFSIADINQTTTGNWKTLEKSLTLTLYFLAQVYEHLSDNETSAKYCHITLKRQIDSNEYDPLDWAVNCATLSQYFIAKDKLKAARHVLASANVVISAYKVKLEVELQNKEDEKWQNCLRGNADISRCWAKYAIHLLASSKHSKLENENKEDNDDLTVTCRLLKSAEVEEVEKKVVSYIITDYEQAKLVFLFGIGHLKEAKNYYILDDCANDFVEIQQDNSKLYKLLATFEEDVNRQCKMHKRRIDLLEDVLNKLNPQHYLAVCRQLMFELAETYSEMTDLKIHIVNAETQQSPLHTMKKINYLVTKSIENYQEFIESLKDAKQNLPKEFSDDVVRPALLAYFCMGRLNSKFIAQSQSKEVEYLRKSEECYNFVLDYVERNPKQGASVKEELPLIKEIIELIPAKIQNVLGGTLY